MESVYYILAFFMGGCFASAAECINYRTLRGQDWIHSHSVCEGCGKTLRWWELIPVLSTLLLKGTCPRCKYFFGYEHAEHECYAGILSVILCLGQQPKQMTVSVCLFGLIMMGVSYATAKFSKE